jgi:hypothetical protein
MKPRGRAAEANANEGRGVFMWDDKTCSDFKPKQEQDKGQPKGGGGS